MIINLAINHFFLMEITKFSSSLGLCRPSMPSIPSPLESSTSVRKHWTSELEAIENRAIKTLAMM